MEHVPEFDYAVLRNDRETGTLFLLNPFCFLDLKVPQGQQTSFADCMEYDYQFLCDHRVASPPTGDGSPQADGVP